MEVVSLEVGQVGCVGVFWLKWEPGLAGGQGLGEAATGQEQPPGRSATQQDRQDT